MPDTTSGKNDSVILEGAWVVNHRVNIICLRPAIGGLPTTKDIYSSYIFSEWGTENWEGPWTK